MITFSKIGNYGRLGNQMFQYAASKSAALNCNTIFALPTESHELSNFFNLDCKFYSLNQNINLINKMKTYSETIFEYDSRFENISDNTSLEGYFQSEKYFKKYENIIRKDLTFKKEILDIVEPYISDLNKENNLVSVHIRRGDYVNLQQYHPLCTIEYYKNAMLKFTNHKFLIFSDDIQWCKNNFGNENNIIYSELNSHIQDMCGMSLCSHNIIANSSFSWWGAWLNDNPNKIVIAPQKWFGESYRDKNTKDIYCDNWIKL
jgi:hypothetical protein